VHFLAAMLTFGASQYVWLLAPKGLAPALRAPIRRLTFVGSLVALLTAILWLMLETSSMVDELSAAVDPQMNERVLSDTAFGHAWAAHLILAAALAGVVIFGPSGRWELTVIASAALLASLGFVGHAAMQSGPEGALHRANHAIHLVAAGAWIGGLVPFVMCLKAYERDDLRRDAVRAMMSFSFWGQFGVAAIVLTGAVNVGLISGHAPIPPTTPYRALLVAKIALVGIMIALAGFNRFILAPRLEPGAAALALLRATSAAEAALGTVVIALVSAFALLNPA
jgi:putative copper resistance protein D